jgi:hypothetical protein
MNNTFLLRFGVVKNGCNIVCFFFPFDFTIKAIQRDEI